MKLHTERTPRSRKILLIALFVFLTISGYFGFYVFNKIWAPNVLKETKLYIPTGADYQQVLDSLRPLLKNPDRFDWLARKRNYTGRVLPGRYTLNEGENNQTLLKRLSTGEQDEIAIRIGNYASIFEIAGKVAPFLESDSLEIVQAIRHSEMGQLYDSAAVLFYFRPETYNFHWNTSGQEFVSRMKSEFDKFWTDKRMQLAAKMQMSPLQVTTLASIVQLESVKVDEQPRVAQLYLNRLAIDMKLDADPTVIFAKRLAKGFTEKIQRVYYKDLMINSPYNTYRNKGLPPGPICMPNASAIDAVLQPEPHDYLYFVADPKRPGYHIFASTLQEQEANAKLYRKWLDSNKIK